MNGVGISESLYELTRERDAVPGLSGPCSGELPGNWIELLAPPKGKGSVRGESTGDLTADLGPVGD